MGKRVLGREKQQGQRAEVGEHGGLPRATRGSEAAASVRGEGERAPDQAGEEEGSRPRRASWRPLDSRGKGKALKWLTSQEHGTVRRNPANPHPGMMENGLEAGMTWAETDSKVLVIERGDPVI